MGFLAEHSGNWNHGEAKTLVVQIKTRIPNADLVNSTGT